MTITFYPSYVLLHCLLSLIFKKHKKVSFKVAPTPASTPLPKKAKGELHYVNGNSNKKRGNKEKETAVVSEFDATCVMH